MLEYQKEVLQKLSFNSFLFLKELNKSIEWLSTKEYRTLLDWVKENYKSLEVES